MTSVPYITDSRTGPLTSQLLSTAGGVVAYAQGRVSVVDGFISRLADQVLSLQPPNITPQFPIGAAAPAVEVPAPPTFATPTWVAPGFPTALVATLETGDLEIAPFDDEPPAVNFGTAPPPFEGAIPDAPAVNFDFDDPTLEVNLPSAPSLLSLQVEKFGGLNLPTFSEADPVLTAVEPTVREYRPGAFYTSGLLSATKASLEDRIRNGGTGINQDVENAIWDRGREREARSAADALVELDKMEALGYALMPGIYLDARLKIATEADANNRGHSREVMIKSAELELDNVKHALTTATQLEGQLLDYTNAVETRMFEAAKYATEAQVQIYNAKVQAFGAMVDVYKTKVAIYEARVRAEISRVDAYRAQIAAEEAKASINRSLVDQYKVQVDVALSNIEVFKARIAGIQTKAEIEKAKVEIFGEQVRGYTAQVNAYTAGVEGFRASIQAEATKQDVYKSRVDAFTARVGATTAQIEARIKAYEGLIAGKNAEYEGYRAAVQGETARVQGITAIAGVEADAYKSRVQSVGMYNDVLTKQWQATLDQQQRVSEIAVSAAKANAELYITTRNLSMDAAKTGATVAAQIGAAAINAFNISGSVSSSNSYGESNSASNSGSTSESKADSKSTNYNYNASV